ncbi:unnamed protein product [Adineta steineri]|uniref:RNI-like protein n=1 Tax=Adineta steineri TaxID=433720 RepID=A0A819SVG7_9BILA|nr:unnamed protein product [Adineta steineri]CAF4062373.1 unnamed protein product [Adineta steineri]
MKSASATSHEKTSKSSKYRNPALEEAIQSTDFGSTLNYSNQLLTELDVPILITQLLNEKKVVELYLLGNEINEKGIQLLADALVNNNTLTILDLSRNPVGVGIETLANSLQTNTTLTTLSLDDTGIDDGGATSLAEMLRHNEALQSLSLGCNKITATGVQNLADALHGSSNSTLEELDLAGNSVDDTCVNDLIHMLKYNKVLRKLYMSSSKLGEEAKEKLRETTRRKANFYFTFDDEEEEEKEEEEGDY